MALAPKTVKDGIHAWQRGDYQAAIAVWTPLAEKGDSDAAFNLGQAHRLGRGTAVNLAKAQAWLERAARSGHLDAQTTLGLLLFDSGNRDSAMGWLRQAAERGEPRAMLVYGTALFNGDNVPRDPLKAYVFVSRAAAEGLGPAKRTLEEMDAILPADTRRKAIELILQKSPKKATRPATNATKSKPPPTAPAARPEQKAAIGSASGKWRIQLGAFSKKASAEALYRKLAGSSPVAGHPAHYVPAGAVTRLQVGGFDSRAAAASACAALSAKGQACFPVEGK